MFTLICCRLLAGRCQHIIILCNAGSASTNTVREPIVLFVHMFGLVAGNGPWEPPMAITVKQVDTNLKNHAPDPLHIKKSREGHACTACIHAQERAHVQ